MNRKIAFRTLGCRLNQYETDSLVSRFHGSGYRIVDFGEPADVYVINTCTVTGQSDKKSRNLISQAARRGKNPLVIVAGCMVTGRKDQLRELLPAGYLVDNERKASIFDLVEDHFRGIVAGPGQYVKDVFGYQAAYATFHTRGLIKIQDGCNNYCTFCIVPFVRGRAASRPVSDILDNINKVLDYGYREIVLTGVNIGRYRFEEMNFEQLVEKILAVNRDFRLRISSMEPDGFGDRFIRLFQDPKLMPHLHLCLQSGSDKILLRMRRMYSLKEYLDIIRQIRESYEAFNLTTDIIVGFPGETEEDFEKTVDVVKEVGFSHIHTFKYSRRKGTRADRMDEQLPERIKSERSEIIRSLAEENKRRYRKSLLGKKQTVLVEKVRGQKGWGYGELYVPVNFPGEDVRENMLQKVILTGLNDGEDPVLTGEPVG